MIPVDASARRDCFFDVSLSAFLSEGSRLKKFAIRPSAGIDGSAEVYLPPFFQPFGRPTFFLSEMEPSGRRDCSLEVSSPTGAMLKLGTIPPLFGGLPRGFRGGRSLSLSSSSKKSWFSNRSSSAGETWSRILATGTSSASRVTTPSS